MRYDVLWKGWRRETDDQHAEQSEQTGGRRGSGLWAKVGRLWRKGSELPRLKAEDRSVKNEGTSFSLGLF